MPQIARTSPRVFAKFGTSRGKEWLEQKRAIALRRWFAALATRSTAPADIMTVGDSILEGAGLTSYLNRPVYLLGKKLQNLFPLPGVTGGYGFVAPFMNASAPADYPVVNVGGSQGLTYGLGFRSLTWTAAASSTITIPGATTIGIRYLQSLTTGSLKWSIDGGATTTIDTSGTPVDFAETKIAIRDQGAHALKVEWVAGTIIFDGFMVYNGDESSGIRVFEGDQAGAGSTSFVGDATLQTRLGDTMATISPDLLIVELGVNDYMGAANIQKTAAQFTTNLETILSIAKSRITNDPSVVLCCMWETYVSGRTGLSPWSDYVDAIYDIADADDDVCVLDFGKRIRLSPNIGAGDTARGLLTSSEPLNPVHPSNAGAAYLAETLARFLSPL